MNADVARRCKKCGKIPNSEHKFFRRGEKAVLGSGKESQVIEITGTMYRLYCLPCSRSSDWFANENFATLAWNIENR